MNKYFLVICSALSILAQGASPEELPKVVPSIPEIKDLADSARSILWGKQDFGMEYGITPKSQMNLPRGQIRMYCKLVKVGNCFRFEMKRSKDDQSPYWVMTFDGTSYYTHDVNPRFLFTGSDPLKFSDDLVSIAATSPFAFVNYLNLKGAFPGFQIGQKLNLTNNDNNIRYEMSPSENMISIGSVVFPKKVEITAFFGNNLDKFDNYLSRDIVITKFSLIDPNDTDKYPPEYFSIPATGNTKIVDFDLGGVEIDM